MEATLEAPDVDTAVPQSPLTVVGDDEQYEEEPCEEDQHEEQAECDGEDAEDTAEEQAALRKLYQ